ncbi:hypothetical protein BR63_02120 [Thermanaerosceptrum fracticalcis]|uniref:Uncharacterized protein n=1 Tax=Thermanaerosceptrum fracticalcis TaxID=1712410 RepID=A0A7G6DZG4_THEFR|nr:hypothetical protein [Thermanaerosceptrum fracticalcis]QNB45218.1 hypothetical protein BR63_02120 [Thermanaerosceptrum fracticalcis]
MAYWMNKKPCWEIKNCSPEKKENCTAFHNQTLPCWAVGGRHGGTCHDTEKCKGCQVYLQYGKGRPILVYVDEKTNA